MAGDEAGGMGSNSVTKDPLGEELKEVQGQSAKMC